MHMCCSQFSFFIMIGNIASHTSGCPNTEFISEPRQRGDRTRLATWRPHNCNWMGRWCDIHVYHSITKEIYFNSILFNSSSKILYHQPLFVCRNDILLACGWPQPTYVDIFQQLPTQCVNNNIEVEHIRQETYYWRQGIKYPLKIELL